MGGASQTRTKSVVETLSYRARVAGLAALRQLRWRTDAAEYPLPEAAPPAERFPYAIYERRLPIARRDEGAHPFLEDGKRANLRLAAPAFDGLFVSPTRPISFWRTLGPLTEAVGYRHGMSLYDGCVVPAVGGGVCLLSNALFEMAVLLGWPIRERHGHSVGAVPPLPGEMWGLDATVFYPYVDLRFAATAPSRLSVRVEEGELVLGVRALAPLDVRVMVKTLDESTERVGTDEYHLNRLVRQIFVGDRLVTEEVVATNRKLFVPPEHAGRSCLTCGDDACHTRTELARTSPAVRAAIR